MVAVGEDEDDRHAGKQDVERDLVWRLLALGAFDERNHAVEEGRALGGRDAYANPIGQNLRAAGHGRAVAARLADDGRRFAGDRGLVDRGDAFDHLAVRRNDVAGLDEHDVADAQRLARNQLVVARRLVLEELGLRLAARAPERVRLSLAAALRDRLGEVGEQHGDPQPQDDLEREAEVGAARRRGRG